MSTVLQDFGRYLKSIRGHIPYRRVAERSGISADELRAFEGGERKPSTEQLESLCGSFDTAGTRKVGRLREMYAALDEREAKTDTHDKYDACRRIIHAGNEMRGWVWNDVVREIGLPELTIYILQSYLRGTYTHSDTVARKLSHDAIEQGIMRAYSVSAISLQEAERLEMELADAKRSLDDFKPVLRKVLMLSPSSRKEICLEAGVCDEYVGKLAHGKKEAKTATYVHIMRIVYRKINEKPELASLRYKSEPSAESSLQDARGLSRIESIVGITIVAQGLADVIIREAQLLTPEQRESLRRKVRDGVGLKKLTRQLEGIDILLSYGEKEWSCYLNPMNVEGTK